MNPNYKISFNSIKERIFNLLQKYSSSVYTTFDGITLAYTIIVKNYEFTALITNNVCLLNKKLVNMLDNKTCRAFSYDNSLDRINDLISWYEQEIRNLARNK